MVNYNFVATPERKSPRGGLLAVANVVDDSTGRTGMGVQYIEAGCSLPVVAPGLCWAVLEPPQVEVEPGVFADAPKLGSGIESAQFDPFALYAAVECFAGPGEDFEDRARALLEGGEGQALEAIFHSEVLDAAPAGTVVGAGALGAVASAEQDAGSYPALATLHMSRRVAVDVEGYLEVDTDTWALHTKQGTPVANGAGYPDDQTIWATGQVTIWRGPIVVNRAVDPTSNRVIAVAERTYAIGYDCFARKYEITA